MQVLVIGQNGIGLMPTTPRNARKLLSAGKATVVQKYPFTIKLNYKTGSATQQVRLGIDTGESHIGIAVTSKNKVLLKSDIELRSSMEKRTLLEARKTFRRSRRYRKTPYRKPKFKFKRKRLYSTIENRRKKHWTTQKNTIQTSRPNGWLPPSIQSKVDHHINWINKFMSALPKDTLLVIEVARFDIQHMMNPAIRNELYQQGRMYEFENVKAYVLAKFGYKCPICGHKFDNDHKAKLHHVTYRSKGATNNPDEYTPICERCHTAKNHEKGGALDKLRNACKRKEYREPTFMNILRIRLWTAFPDAEFTYGNMTCTDRKRLCLEKSHANDAIAITLRDTKYSSVIDQDKTLHIKQVRTKKRSLHEANPRKGRKEPNRTAKRNCKNVSSVGNFTIYDTVKTKDGQTGFISGFSQKSAYIVDFDGKYINPVGKTYKQHNLSSLKLYKKRTNNYISRIR